MAKQPHNSIAKYNSDFDQFVDNITRVRYLKYFIGTKPSFTEEESTGFFVGAFLSFLFGLFIIPYLLGRDSHFDGSPAISIASSFFMIAGIILAVWGLIKHLKERKKEHKPVEDEEYDRYLAYDMKALSIKARQIVNSKSEPILKGNDSIDEVEPIILSSAEQYSSNTNLPCRVKAGKDGFIRASNLKAMFIYPSNKSLYIYTTYLNLCDGTSKFDHVYVCDYENVASVKYIKRKEQQVTAKGVATDRKVKSFIITSDSGNTSEVSINIVDYDFISATGGKFKEDAAEAALERLSYFFPKKQLPTKKASGR